VRIERAAVAQSLNRDDAKRKNVPLPLQQPRKGSTDVSESYER
jgi:hypothetical protein